MQAVDLAAAPADCAFPPPGAPGGGSPEEEGEQPVLSHAAPRARGHAGRAWPADLAPEVPHLGFQGGQASREGLLAASLGSGGQRFILIL